MPEWFWPTLALVCAIVLVGSFLYGFVEGIFQGITDRRRRDG